MSVVKQSIFSRFIVNLYINIRCLQNTNEDDDDDDGEKCNVF